MKRFEIFNYLWHKFVEFSRTLTQIRIDLSNAISTIIHTRLFIPNIESGNDC